MATRSSSATSTDGGEAALASVRAALAQRFGTDCRLIAEMLDVCSKYANNGGSLERVYAAALDLMTPVGVPAKRPRTTDNGPATAARIIAVFTVPADADQLRVGTMSLAPPSRASPSARDEGTAIRQALEREADHLVALQADAMLLRNFDALWSSRMRMAYLYELVCKHHGTHTAETILTHRKIGSLYTRNVASLGHALDTFPEFLFMLASNVIVRPAWTTLRPLLSRKYYNQELKTALVARWRALLVAARRRDDTRQPFFFDIDGTRRIQLHFTMFD